MKTREDEIRYLIYLKGQLIKQTKKRNTEFNLWVKEYWGYKEIN